MSWLTATIPAPVVTHAAPHFDARGFCMCGGTCCVGTSDGTCFCPPCPCHRINACEATEGPCRRCRP